MLAVPGFEFIAPMGLLSCVSVELRCCPGMLPRKLFLTAASLAPDVLSGGREVMSEENSRLLVSRGAAAAAHGRSYVAVLLWHFPGGRVWICAILCLTQSRDLTKVGAVRKPASYVSSPFSARGSLGSGFGRICEDNSKRVLHSLSHM